MLKLKLFCIEGESVQPLLSHLSMLESHMKIHAAEGYNQGTLASCIHTYIIVKILKLILTRLLN